MIDYKNYRPEQKSSTKEIAIDIFEIFAVFGSFIMLTIIAFSF